VCGDRIRDGRGVGDRAAHDEQDGRASEHERRPGDRAQARERDQGSAGQDACRKPGDNDSEEWLVGVAGELLEGQRAAHVRPGRKPAHLAQEIQPPHACEHGEHHRRRRYHAARDSANAVRRRLIAAVLVAWLGAGLYGVESYASHYYTYRGFDPPKDPVGIARGRLEKASFFSAALGQERRYLIYLPPGYDRASAAGKRFPVLYLLHGAPGFPVLFVNAGALGVAMDKLVAERQIRPMLVVMPSGRDGSFRSDTEWANTPHGHWEDFVLDVVRDVDARFPTIPDRAHRAIAGNSEGGFASVNIALHHLQVFGVAESWSGYFTQKAEGPFKRASAAAIYRNSPALYVPSMSSKLRRWPLHVFIYTGKRDHDRHRVAAFAQQLGAAGAQVHFALYPGRHEWRLWRSQTPHMLRWANLWFDRRAVV
jgi:enterochelin esterase-like enzyme